MAEANTINNNKLPPEILVKIFEYCRLKLNEMAKILDVCQLWRDVAIHHYMSVNDLAMRSADDIYNLVTLLCKPVSFSKLHVVWDVPRGLDCRSVSVNALRATSFTNLQSFAFKVKKKYLYHDRDRPDLYYGVLDALLMSLRQTSTDTLTRFKVVNTSGCNQTTRSKVVEVIEACQHLSHLVLNGCWFDDVNRKRCVDIIPTLTHLELLDLRGTSQLENLSFIAAVKRGCPNISNNIMIAALRFRPSDDASMLQFVSYIRILTIVNLGTDKLTSLIRGLDGCIRRLIVERLNVSSCKYHLTDDILLSLVQRLHRLKEVNASECRQLTNEGVVNVVTSLPELKMIYISEIKNIDTGIIQLLDDVIDKKNVHIYARQTKLSDQMRNNPGRELYTGSNRNIRLQYRW